MAENKVEERILNLEDKVEEVTKQSKEMLTFIISRNKYSGNITTMSKSVNTRYRKRRKKNRAKAQTYFLFFLEKSRKKISQM